MSLTDKRLRNSWVQGRYDALMAEGKHGHYETMFRLVREAVEAERAACADIAEGIGSDRGYDEDVRTAAVMIRNIILSRNVVTPIRS